MKKFLLFLIILLLPSAIAFFAISHYFPRDFELLSDLLKEKSVAIYPWLNRYFHVIKKQEIKKEVPPPVIEKPIVPNLFHFTNAEIYAPICGEEIKENFANLFMGCRFCPKYLNEGSQNRVFDYFSEARGKIFKKEYEEAVVFMKGCSHQDHNGMAITIQKGYGGWQRVSVLDDVVFDQAPLEFKDSDDFFIFIARRTTINKNHVLQEIMQVKVKGKELRQRVLFSVSMVRGEKCDRSLQASLENPTKVNDKEFQVDLEIIGCQKNKISGSYHLIFNLKENDFFPNKKTASLMTKIEKIGESK